MKHELIKLPYSYGALAPVLSKETLTYHHDKHHRTYVNKLNDLITGTDYENMDLIEVIKQSEGTVFNNAAQIFNHDFYFKSMSPLKTEISEALNKAIILEFGLLEDLKKEFIQKALAHFGSGWIWLVVDDMGKLSIRPTSNAMTPIIENLTPLLVCDVWEHAYYIDYRNSRPTYMEKWWGIINWEFVSKNYEKVSETFKPDYVDDSDATSINPTHVEEKL